jgi:hypothetical protein
MTLIIPLKRFRVWSAVARAQVAAFAPVYWSVLKVSTEEYLFVIAPQGKDQQRKQLGPLLAVVQMQH